MEIWKDIKGYEGFYQVSNQGRVKSLISNDKILGGKITSTEYRQVTLMGKAVLVHRLVANAFIENPLNKPEVNHKDGNPLNNVLDNLEWVTRAENAQHAVAIGLMKTGSAHHRAHMTETDAHNIKELYPLFSKPEIAELLQISYACVSSVLLGYSWTRITGLPKRTTNKLKTA